MAIVINGSGTITGLSAGGLPDASVATADIADNAITLDKMVGGTDGNIISYDASGDPVAVVTGSSGQVLTSAGAGAPPTFAAAAGGGNSFFAIATRNVATATGTFTVTGLGFAPNSLVVTALITTTDAYAWGYACDNASDNGACFHSVGGDSSDALHNNGSFFARTPTSAGNDADFAISTWDSDGITRQHTKSGSPTGTATLNIMFFG